MKFLQALIKFFSIFSRKPDLIEVFTKPQMGRRQRRNAARREQKNRQTHMSKRFKMKREERQRRKRWSRRRERRELVSEIFAA